MNKLCWTYRLLGEQAHYRTLDINLERRQAILCVVKHLPVADESVITD